MEINRFILMTLLEVVTSVVHRLGFHDLHEKCQDCCGEVDAQESDEKKEG